MACDICGKTGETLQALREEYRTDKIYDLCSSCMKETNDTLWKIRKLTTNLNYSFTKKFMIELKHKLKGVVE